jgi:hypothetical protein
MTAFKHREEVGEEADRPVEVGEHRHWEAEEGEVRFHQRTAGLEHSDCQEDQAERQGQKYPEEVRGQAVHPCQAARPERRIQGSRNTEDMLAAEQMNLGAMGQHRVRMIPHCIPGYCSSRWGLSCRFHGCHAHAMALRRRNHHRSRRHDRNRYCAIARERLHQ